MPREELTESQRVERLQILDDEGVADPELEPEIDSAILLDLYRAMLVGRRFDERMLALQRQGRIGTFPPITGQEAAQLGAVYQLGAGDWLVPAFRETAAEIWRGRSLESILYYYNGFIEGNIIDAASHDMPMAVPVATQILHAVGLAYAAKYRRTGEIVMTFFGDGATSEGDFHEAMNCASVYQVPTIFLCQNNHWAISIPLKRQMRMSAIARKALAYGMPGIQVDGNDILAVLTAAGEAAERARNGGGPTLIECVTYRLLMHTTADDPKRYRGDEEVEAWRKKDPLLRFGKYLRAKNILDEGVERGMEEEVKSQINRSVEAAEEKMSGFAETEVMFDHLYYSLPVHLERQREEHRRLRMSGGEEDDDG